MVGSIYWYMVGATPDWKARYPSAAKEYPSGGFVVLAGDLVFSVTVFVVCSLVCLGALAARRAATGAELGGGNGKYALAALFALLWVCYIAASSASTLGVLPEVSMPPLGALLSA